MSVFSGSAWTWNEERQAYYFHQFSSEQPDFNLDNEKVANEMKVRITVQQKSETVVINPRALNMGKIWPGQLFQPFLKTYAHRFLIATVFSILWNRKYVNGFALPGVFYVGYGQMKMP